MPGKKFLYLTIYEQLRDRIQSGQMLPGDRLPSEEELSQAYSVSRITVKKALERLREDGLIHRVQGRGTFVRAIEPAAGRAQACASSRLVGVVLEHVSSSFGLIMMYTMTRLLDEAGYKTCIRFTFGSIGKESEEIEDLLGMNVAGLIIMPCHDSHYNLAILRLILEKFPVVLVDKRMHGLPVSSVCTDGREAMRQLVLHLRERGCGSAAMLTIDPASTSSLGDRAEGFFKGIEEAGMRCAGECILPRRTGDMISNEPEQRYIEAIGAYLDGLGELPDSFVCTEYAIGRALYAAAQARGLMPGKAFRACCIDEDELGTQGSFFTHMRQDEENLARRTVEILLRQIRGETHVPIDARVPTVFHQGQTT